MSSITPIDSRQSTSARGYDKLALFLSNHPQMMIFRSFSTLSAKYSLYLQAQLSHLEKDLEVASRIDRESEDPERRNFQYSWWDLHRARKEEDFQIQKFDEVGKTMEKYCQIPFIPRESILWSVTNPVLLRKDNWLLLQKEVCKLKPPSSADLTYLRKWLEKPDEGNKFLKNKYAEGEAWDKPDLISVRVNEVMEVNQMDELTKWIHGMLPWFHERWGCRLRELTPADEERGIGESWRYSNNSIARAISMTSTMLAALWPIAAIFVLNLIPNFTVRLVISVAFTLLFALTVQVIASPGRVQLFAATTAYAAMLVTTERFNR